MPERGIRSVYSQCPFDIEMWDDEGVISSGTAFYFEHGGERYLITNWHNFAGRDPFTSQPLQDKAVARFPTFIKAKLAACVDVPGLSHRGPYGFVSRRVEIYENYEPLWLEHPVLGRQCDVVALPFERPNDCPENLHDAVNRIDLVRIPVLPGGTVYIIGFPHGISVGPGFPIWKSGYIASEPHFDVTIAGERSEFGGLKGGRRLPAFFIDSQTRPGMSGSPAFASYIGTWDSSDPYSGLDFQARDSLNLNAIFLGSSSMEFVGCYSARIGAKEEGAALGLCWRKDVIELICSNKQTGVHPHISSS